METIILASGSPRRRELLAKVKLPIKVIPPGIVEDHSTFDSVPELVASLARAKVEAILTLFKTESPRWVLGLDTVVEVDGKVLGKPAGPEEAETHAAPAFRQGAQCLLRHRPPGGAGKTDRGGSRLHGGEVPGRWPSRELHFYLDPENGQAPRGRTGSRSGAHSSSSGSAAPTATS